MEDTSESDQAHSQQDSPIAGDNTPDTPTDLENE